MTHPATKWIVLSLTLDRAMQANPARARGKGLVALRREVADGSATLTERPRDTPISRQAEWLVNVWFAEMAPDQPDALPILHDDTRVLIDALCFKRGFTRREDAWASLGISNNTGVGWVNPNKPGIMRWPAFASLRAAVMEGE